MLPVLVDGQPQDIAYDVETIKGKHVRSYQQNGQPVPGKSVICSSLKKDDDFLVVALSAADLIAKLSGHGIIEVIS